MNRPKVLFVMDRWCDGNWAAGVPSVHHHTQLGAFQAADMGDSHVIFFDEECRNGSHPDIALERYCSENHVDLIVNAPLVAHMCPSHRVLMRAQSRGTKLACLWFDTVLECSRTEIVRFWQCADLNIIIDLDRDAFPNCPNPIYLWQPVDTKAYFPLRSTETHEHDISFVGWVSQRPDRREFMEAAMALPYRVYVGGGQRERYVSDEEYERILRTSRISVNFSQSGAADAWHFKGRAIEITFSGAMLLDNLNYHTSRFFEPGKEYVGFTSKDDFLDKVRYYLTHDAERAAIARRAHEKAAANYGPRQFWEKVFDRLEIPYRGQKP